MKFKKTKLKNGLRIITVPLKDNPAVTVLVMVETGSKYETKNLNGLSHFLEHMCFKGTKKRPSAFVITKELDSIGAQYNAFTSQEFTGYYAKAHFKHYRKVIDIISDLYLNPILPEKEIQKEKGVIIEEINMYEDTPQRQIGDVFMSLLYGSQPAGSPVIGSPANVMSFKRSDFTGYVKEHYVAKATTVVVAGNFDQKSVKGEIEMRFKNISVGRKSPKVSVKESQKKPAVLIKYKDTDQTHLMLGVRAFRASDERLPALKVLNSVLGGGMSSRIFQKLRDEMGVGYYVRSFSDEYTDHGYLSVACGIDKKRLEEVISAILAEFKKLKDELVLETELKKAKDYLIGSLFLGLETSDSLAEFYGYEEVLHRPLKSLQEWSQEIKAVSSTDVKNIAQEIFQKEGLNLAVIGRVKDKKKLETALKL
jgi:predicted Zn-dependent peptidase